LLSAFSYLLSAFSELEPRAVETGNRRPETGDRKPETGNRPEAAGHSSHNSSRQGPLDWPLAVYSVEILTTLFSRLATALLIALSLAACRTAAGDSPAPAPAAGQGGPAIIQPGAPGESSRVVDAAKATDLSKVQHTTADVKFMQGMIGHHAQALEMTALLATRTASDDMRKLALRIDVSQADEIKMMQEWLQARGQPLPDPHAHHAPGAPLMPGMLTAEEMGRLAAAKGVEFDRLFLEFMIKHHIGALTMVKDLFATAGAGQDNEIFTFASDVDADQRMEIDRMGAMLVQLKERQ
jgi:uncharacterized protein (DUF305 family)